MAHSSDTIKSAMLLSAGFGTRLAPLSGLRPKPLFPVLNRPILHYWLAKLQDCGLRKVVVNTHYLAGQIEAEIKKWRSEFSLLEIVISPEKEILGTGGGLKKAEKHFGEPFLVVNSDIYTDFPLTELAASFFSSSGSLATLAVSSRAEGTVSVDEGGRVLAFRGLSPVPGERHRLYGLGMMVLSPEVLKNLPSGNSDIILCLNEIIRRGGRVDTLFSENPFWSDLGTPGDYYTLNHKLAKGGRFVEEGALIHGATSGFLVAEAGTVIEPGSFVENSILWSGAKVESGCVLRSMIVAGRVRSGVKMYGGVITSF